MAEKARVPRGIAQILHRIEEEAVGSESEVPVIVEYRGQKARIYGKSKGYDYYRLAFRADGKRALRTFSSYGAAKAEAEKTVRRLPNADPLASLTRSQAEDARTALKKLRGFNSDAGQELSLSDAIADFCRSARKLGGVALSDAVDAYLATVATVTPKDLSEAVEQFINMREPLAKAEDGKRPQLSPV